MADVLIDDLIGGSVKWKMFVCLFASKSGDTGGNKSGRFDFNGVIEGADKIFMWVIKLYFVCYFNLWFSFFALKSALLMH